MPELPDICVYIEALERRTEGRVLEKVRIAGNPDGLLDARAYELDITAVRMVTEKRGAVPHDSRQVKDFARPDVQHGILQELGQQAAQPVRLGEHQPFEDRPVFLVQIGSTQLLHGAPDGRERVLDFKCH